MLAARRIGERIYTIRNMKNISLEMLCQRLNEESVEISIEVMGKIEAGKRIASNSEIMKIADVIDIDVMYLLGEDEDQDIINKLRHSDKFRDDEESLEEIEEVLYFARSFIRQKLLREKFTCELPLTLTAGHSF